LGAPGTDLIAAAGAAAHAAEERVRAQVAVAAAAASASHARTIGARSAGEEACSISSVQVHGISMLVVRELTIVVHSYHSKGLYLELLWYAVTIPCRCTCTIEVTHG
jgi:hypothetical protein